MLFRHHGRPVKERLVSPRTRVKVRRGPLRHDKGVCMLPAENKLTPTTPKKDTQGAVGEASYEGKSVDLDSLSKLTGFPVDFIKKELALADSEVPLEDLRKSMLTFLDSTFEGLKAR